MRLTELEGRALERLRTKQKRWPRFRWAFMLSGVLFVALGLVLDFQFERTLLECSRSLSFTEPTTGIELYFSSRAAFMLSVAHLCFWFGVAVVVFVVVRWRGNPSDILILRLVSELEPNQGSGDPAGHGASAV